MVLDGGTTVVDDGRSTVDGKNEKREKTQKGSIEPITAIILRVTKNPTCHA